MKFPTLIVLLVFISTGLFGQDGICEYRPTCSPGNGIPLCTGFDQSNCEFFSDCCRWVTLPVELTYFNTEHQDGSIQLQWATASETSNRGFEVQHSHNGVAWSNLAFVEGHGTTTEEHKYEYPVEPVTLGINYFRLKQIDMNGQFEFSEIRSILYWEKATNAVKLYPNPVLNGALNIDLLNEVKEFSNLSLFDSKGQLLRMEVLNGQHSQVTFNGLLAGIYFVEVTNGKDVWRERLVVQ